MLGYVAFMVECAIEDAKPLQIEKDVQASPKRQTITAQDFDQWAVEVQQEDKNIKYKSKTISDIDTQIFQRMQTRLGLLRMIRRQERKKLRK